MCACVRARACLCVCGIVTCVSAKQTASRPHVEATLDVRFYRLVTVCLAARHTHGILPWMQANISELRQLVSDLSEHSIAGEYSKDESTLWSVPSYRGHAAVLNLHPPRSHPCISLDYFAATGTEQRDCWPKVVKNVSCGSAFGFSQDTCG